MVERVFYIFAILLLLISFMEVKNKTNDTTKEDLPLVEAYDFDIKQINNDGISQQISGSIFQKYEKKELMSDANIQTDEDMTIEAKKIKKIKNMIYLDRDIKIKTNNLVLYTDQLVLNNKTKILTNSNKYHGLYNDIKISGNNLFVDMNKKEIKSTDVVFEQ